MIIKFFIIIIFTIIKYYYHYYKSMVKYYVSHPERDFGWNNELKQDQRDQSRVVTKDQGPGISPGYSEHGPRGYVCH